jgi:hypothetical protein
MTRGGAEGSTLQAGQRVVVQVLRERAADPREHGLRGRERGA